MKRNIILLGLTCFLSLTKLCADNYVINNVSVPQGGTASLVIGYNFTSETEKVGFTLSMALPDGLSIQEDEGGDPLYVKDASINKLNVLFPSAGSVAGQPSSGTSAISGTSGTLLTLTLVADGSLEVGSELTIPVTKATFQQRVGGSVTDINIDDFSFKVTISEPSDGRTILDENSTSAPEASGGAVDVRVRRTIRANQWSTICLPFAMTSAQLVSAFGSDVQLANFTGYEAEFDDDDNVVGITVSFSNVTAIEKNHPYIIKVSANVSEFTVDGVTIDPEEAVVATVKRTRKQWSELIGTYVANTEVPSKTLFLNSNKFYYSTGATKMKGYRAYFDFYDVLTDVDENYEVKMLVDGFETKVEGVSVRDVSGSIFDLSGRKVRNPHRGVFIVNGRKALIK